MQNGEYTLQNAFKNNILAFLKVLFYFVIPSFKIRVILMASLLKKVKKKKKQPYIK